MIWCSALTECRYSFGLSMFSTFSYTVFLPISIILLSEMIHIYFSWLYTLNSVLLSWLGLPCVKWVLMSVQLTWNSNPVLRSLLPHLWVTIPRWATVQLSCRNTSKRCLRLPCSAGWAPADRLRPSALMTYRLGHCGIHVSGQCHGPTAKTVGEGEKESRWLLPVLSDRGLAPGLCHITPPLHPPTDRKWRMWRAKMGGGGVLEGHSTT